MFTTGELPLRRVLSLTRLSGRNFRPVVGFYLLMLVPDAAGTAAIGLLGYSLIGRRDGAAVRSPRCPDGRKSRVAIPASNWKGARPHSRRGQAFFCAKLLQCTCGRATADLDA
jgi:hypothetical protein